MILANVAPTDKQGDTTVSGEELQTGSAASPSPAVSSAPPPSASQPTETNVEAADEVKEAVLQQNQTAGDAVNALDAMAIEIGGMRISVWDGTFVILVVIGILLLGWIGSKLTHKALRKITRLDPSQRLLADKIISIIIWSLAIMIGLDLLGVDLTALAVFSGAFGLAIGFGLQKTIGNFIAGIILLMDKSIKPGDIITVADQAGNSTFGQIRKIGIRAVSITTRDQKEYLIPNENLMINQVENWSYSSKQVRIQVPVGVAYGCDIHIAERLMMEAAQSCSRVLKTPQPSVWLDQYGESSVDFIIHCWISDPEQGIGNVKSEVLKKLWDLFRDNDIEIPFPQRDLNLRDSPQIEQLIAAISQRVEQRKS